MKVVVLGLASDDIEKELREMQIAFGEAVESAAAREPVVSALQTMFFTPIVTRPGIGPFADKTSYLRSEPAVNVAINLSHQRWIDGDRSEHVNMLAEALVRAINQVKESKLSPEAKAGLRQVVEEARLLLMEQFAMRIPSDIRT